MLPKAAWPWTWPQSLRRIPGRWWWRRRQEEEEPLKKVGGREEAPPEPTPSPTPVTRLLHSLSGRRDPEEFRICFNLSRHLFDLCVSSLLGLCSPLFRLALDVAGLRGPLRLWLHGLAAFLVTAGGLHLLLCLLHAYLLHFACLYGLLQAAVLAVSVRGGGRGVGGGPEEEEDDEDVEFALAPEMPAGEEEEGPR
uniref:Uncharacterized protein C6orf47 homolog n=1 Tax=Geotrypetes seraphini TaxID=260995 RepID=A0A6P8NQ59_GEOSA|nr:uncharacterized protein C6orf47 homolog [Geotrypetes seraphini]